MCNGSAFGGWRQQKRSPGAFVHLYFNLIGTVVFMIIVYSVNFVMPLAFFGEQADALGIAIIHSVFNVFTTLLLLPFNRQLKNWPA